MLRFQRYAARLRLTASLLYSAAAPAVACASHAHRLQCDAAAAAATAEAPRVPLVARDGAQTAEEVIAAMRGSAPTPSHSVSDSFKDDGVRLLRKPRGDHTTTAPSPAAAAAGDAELIPVSNLEVAVVMPSALVESFNAFARRSGGRCCTARDFDGGARHAYHALGTLVDTVAKRFLSVTLPPRSRSLTPTRTDVEQFGFTAEAFLTQRLAPLEQWRHGDLAPHIDAGVLETVLRYKDTPLGQLTDEQPADTPYAGPTAPPLTRFEQERFYVARVAAGLMAALPLGPPLALKVAKQWLHHCQGKGNLYTVAGPNDYVMASELQLFADLRGSASVQISEGWLRSQDGAVELEYRVAVGGKEATRKRVVSSKAAAAAAAESKGEEAPKTATAASAPRGWFSRFGAGGGKPTTPKEGFVVTQGALRLSGTTATDGTASSSSPPRPPKEEGEKEGKSGGDTQPRLGVTLFGSRVPAGALACAVMSLDVVVPPRRFAAQYNWYYSRLVGCEDAVERAGFARLFALNGPHTLVRALDFLSRFLSGRDMEFQVNRSLMERLGLDVGHHPPATRMAACFYLDSTHRWVLLDVVPAQPVDDVPLPAA